MYDLGPITTDYKNKTVLEGFIILSLIQHLWEQEQPLVSWFLLRCLLTWDGSYMSQTFQQSWLHRLVYLEGQRQPLYSPTGAGESHAQLFTGNSRFQLSYCYVPKSAYCCYLSDLVVWFWSHHGCRDGAAWGLTLGRLRPGVYLHKINNQIELSLQPSPYMGKSPNRSHRWIF